MSSRFMGALKERLSLLFARPRSRKEFREKEVIRGSAGNVIIVKSPNTEYFKEAIFILCDDLFTRRGIDRKQLMREAREAAFSYVSERVPPQKAGVHRFLVPFLLGASSCYVVLSLLKLV